MLSTIFSSSSAGDQRAGIENSQRIARCVVKIHNPDHALLLLELKCLIAAMFRPDVLEPGAIADDLPLLEAGLCLDSIDALELAICVEEKFGIAIRGRSESQRVFASLGSLANFLSAHAPARIAPSPVSADVRMPLILSAGWAL
jgi:acyl carrier protein